MKVTIASLTLLAGFTASGLVNAAEYDEVWHQWRGAARDGKVEGQPWPASISEENLKTQWKIALQPSYSSPIVTKDHVFVTETRDKKTEVASAWDRKTGEKVWETSWEGAMTVPFFAASNGSWIRATPVYDGTNLYVSGIRDVIVCLDAATGEEKWKLDCVAKFKSALPSFGFVTSPLIVGEHLYTQAGGGFLKLNKDTGEVVWRTLTDGGGMGGSAFSSPVMATLNGREQLVVQTRTELTGVDPESGDVLWRQEIPAFRGMNILTPTVIDDSIFTSSYGGGAFLYKVGGSAEKTSVEAQWRNKVQGYMSSPVVIDGHVYMHLRNQRFTCIEIATGEEKWITRPYGKYWSLVAQGKRILALDERGDLLLIDASPEEFKLVEKRHVSDESTWAHLVTCDDQVFVRDLKGLTVYQWTGEPAQTASR